jgi:hypothetical protein
MAAKRPKGVPGFFATCWLFKSKIVFAWDFVGAVIAAVAAFVLPSDVQVAALSEKLAVSALGVGLALVGVVVAGLAVIVAFLDDEFLAVMDEATERYGGVEGQLFPFWFVTGTGVATIILSATVLLTHEILPTLALRLGFVGIAALLVWTSLGVFNLVAGLQSTGVSRAIYARRRRPKP